MAKFLGFWRDRFAWLPTRMDNGQLVWLRTFEQRQVIIGSDWFTSDNPILVTMRRLPPERMIP